MKIEKVLILSDTSDMCSQFVFMFTINTVITERLRLLRLTGLVSKSIKR